MQRMGTERQSMKYEMSDWRVILVISGMVAVFLELLCGAFLFVGFGVHRPLTLSASIRLAMTAVFIAVPWLASAASYRMLRRSMPDMESVHPSTVKLVKYMRATLLSAYIALMFCVVTFSGWPAH
jgi:hypothetical protein